MTIMLERPVEYVDVLDEELDEIDGGSISVSAVAGIVVAAVTVFGATYQAGQVAGQRAYYAGLRNSAYQKVKWQVRSSVIGGLGMIGLAGAILGGVVMAGFENKFYSMS